MYSLFYQALQPLLQLSKQLLTFVLNPQTYFMGKTTETGSNMSVNTIKCQHKCGEWFAVWLFTIPQNDSTLS